MRILYVIAVSLEMMWTWQVIGQELPKDARIRPPRLVTNQRAGTRLGIYPVNQRRYPPRRPANVNRNLWHRNQQGSGRIVPPNSGPRRRTYPGRRPAQIHPKYQVPSYPLYGSRYIPVAQYRPRPYPRVNPPYRPGYVPAYRPVPQKLHGRRYPPAPAQFNPLQGWQNIQGRPPAQRQDVWGPWGPWSACSRSCDGGVRTRTRSCQGESKLATVSLHKGNGNSVNQGNCPGSPHDFQPCSTKLCTSQKSFKDQKYEARMIQCGAYNNINYLGKKYDWVPYIRTTLNECRLYCMANGHRMFVELAKEVKDGTPCGTDGTEACHHGECTKLSPKVYKPAPANKVKPETSRALLGTERRVEYNPQPKVKFVKKVVHGTFNSTSGLKLGYNRILKVPIGATDIYVAEKEPSRNYLAMKIDGQYVINGKWEIDLSKEIRAAGTLIRYKITTGQYSTESFSAKGPILQQIDVELLYQEEAPLIVYNYTIKAPDLSATKRSSVAHAPSFRVAARGSSGQYQWRISTMTPCSAPCGGGEQEFVYRCSSMQPDGRPVFVADFLCGHSAPPRSKRVCNIHQCPSRWVALPWKPCTKTCGRGGVQLRDIRCRKLTKRNGKDTEINVPINQCNIQTRPAIQRECPYRPCYHVWKVGQWSACSKSCDKGIQERKIHCVSGEGFPLRPAMCDQNKKPPVKQPCVRRSCQSQWFASRWGKCSTQCGEGIQRRIVYCAGVGGSAMPGAQCNDKEKPYETRKCQVGSCSGIWLTSNWTKCSSVCGPGAQSRVVICAAVHEGKFKEVSSTECNAKARPAAKQECTIGPCSETVWFMTPWSKCSNECGIGVQRRRVTCLTSDGHAGRGCQLEEKPSEERRCESRICSTKREATASHEKETAETQEKGSRAVAPSTVTTYVQALTPFPKVYKLQDRPKTQERRIAHSVKVPIKENSDKDEENSSQGQKSSAEEGKKIKENEPNYIAKVSPITRSTQRPRVVTLPSAVTVTTVTTTKSPLSSTRANPYKAKKKQTSNVKRIDSSTVQKILKSKNRTCQDEKSPRYCKVILRLRFCKFVLYGRRCCATCSKLNKS